MGHRWRDLGASGERLGFLSKKYRSDMGVGRRGIGPSRTLLVSFGAPETFVEEPLYGYVHSFAA
jgi:hypothetical protein